MASKTVATGAILLVNLLFFTMVSSTPDPCSPPLPPKTYEHPSPPPKTYEHSPPPPKTHEHPPPPTKTHEHPPPPPKALEHPPPPPKTHEHPPPPPKTHEHPPLPSPAPATCPKDTLKLGVCANLLDDLLHLVVGTPPKTPCCSLIQGLADFEAAVCLCTAIKANILGINLNIPISLSLLLNYCGKDVPKSFQCA